MAARIGRTSESESSSEVSRAHRAVEVQRTEHVREPAPFPAERALERAAAVRADRASIIETRGMTVLEALSHAWANGMNPIVTEGIEGAKRFSAGAGRHGDFEEI